MTGPRIPLWRTWLGGSSKGETNEETPTISDAVDPVPDNNNLPPADTVTPGGTSQVSNPPSREPSIRSIRSIRSPPHRLSIDTSRSTLSRSASTKSKTESTISEPWHYDATPDHPLAIASDSVPEAHTWHATASPSSPVRFPAAVPWKDDGEAPWFAVASEESPRIVSPGSEFEVADQYPWYTEASPISPVRVSSPRTPDHALDDDTTPFFRVASPTKPFRLRKKKSHPNATSTNGSTITAGSCTPGSECGRSTIGSGSEYSHPDAHDEDDDIRTVITTKSEPAKRHNKKPEHHDSYKRRLSTTLPTSLRHAFLSALSPTDTSPPPLPPRPTDFQFYSPTRSEPPSPRISCTGHIIRAAAEGIDETGVMLSRIMRSAKRVVGGNVPIAVPGKVVIGNADKEQVAEVEMRNNGLIVETERLWPIAVGHTGEVGMESVNETTREATLEALPLDPVIPVAEGELLHVESIPPRDFAQHDNVEALDVRRVIPSAVAQLSHMGTIQAYNAFYQPPVNSLPTNTVVSIASATHTDIATPPSQHVTLQPSSNKINITRVLPFAAGSQTTLKINTILSSNQIQPSQRVDVVSISPIITAAQKEVKTAQMNGVEPAIPPTSHISLKAILPQAIALEKDVTVQKHEMSNIVRPAMEVNTAHLLPIVGTTMKEEAALAPREAVAEPIACTVDIQSILPAAGVRLDRDRDIDVNMHDPQIRRIRDVKASITELPIEKDVECVEAASPIDMDYVFPYTEATAIMSAESLFHECSRVEESQQIISQTTLPIAAAKSHQIDVLASIDVDAVDPTPEIRTDLIAPFVGGDFTINDMNVDTAKEVVVADESTKKEVPYTLLLPAADANTIILNTESVRIAMEQEVSIPIFLHPHDSTLWTSESLILSQSDTKATDPNNISETHTTRPRQNTIERYKRLHTPSSESLGRRIMESLSGLVLQPGVDVIDEESAEMYEANAEAERETVIDESMGAEIPEVLAPRPEEQTEARQEQIPKAPQYVPMAYSLPTLGRDVETSMSSDNVGEEEIPKAAEYVPMTHALSMLGRNMEADAVADTNPATGVEAEGHDESAAESTVDIPEARDPSTNAGSVSNDQKISLASLSKADQDAENLKSRDSTPSTAILNVDAIGDVEVEKSFDGHMESSASLLSIDEKSRPGNAAEAYSGVDDGQALDRESTMKPSRIVVEDVEPTTDGAIVDVGNDGQVLERDVTIKSTPIVAEDVEPTTDGAMLGAGSDGQVIKGDSTIKSTPIVVEEVEATADGAIIEAEDDGQMPERDSTIRSTPIVVEDVIHIRAGAMIKVENLSSGDEIVRDVNTQPNLGVEAPTDNKPDVRSYNISAYSAEPPAQDDVQRNAEPLVETNVKSQEQHMDRNIPTTVIHQNSDEGLVDILIKNSASASKDEEMGEVAHRTDVDVAVSRNDFTKTNEKMGELAHKTGAEVAVLRNDSATRDDEMEVLVNEPHSLQNSDHEAVPSTNARGILETRLDVESLEGSHPLNNHKIVQNLESLNDQQHDSTAIVTSNQDIPLEGSEPPLNAAFQPNNDVEEPEQTVRYSDILDTYGSRRHQHTLSMDSVLSNIAVVDGGHHTRPREEHGQNDVQNSLRRHASESKPIAVDIGDTNIHPPLPYKNAKRPKRPIPFPTPRADDERYTSISSSSVVDSGISDLSLTLSTLGTSTFSKGVVRQSVIGREWGARMLTPTPGEYERRLEYFVPMHEGRLVVARVDVDLDERVPMKIDPPAAVRVSSVRRVGEVTRGGERDLRELERGREILRRSLSRPRGLELDGDGDAKNGRRYDIENAGVDNVREAGQGSNNWFAIVCTILAVISYTMLVSIMHTAGPLLARSPLYGNPTPGAAHLAQAGFLVASLGGLGIWIGLGGISSPARLLGVSMGVFAVSTGVAAALKNWNAVIGCLIVAGLAGGGTIPLAFLIVRDIVANIRWAVRVYAIQAFTIILTLTFSPLIGHSVIHTTHAYHAWIFLIPVLVAVLALGFGIMAVRSAKSSGPTQGESGTTKTMGLGTTLLVAMTLAVIGCLIVWGGQKPGSGYQSMGVGSDVGAKLLEEGVMARVEVEEVRPLVGPVRVLHGPGWTLENGEWVFDPLAATKVADGSVPTQPPTATTASVSVVPTSVATSTVSVSTTPAVSTSAPSSIPTSVAAATATTTSASSTPTISPINSGRVTNLDSPDPMIQKYTMMDKCRLPGYDIVNPQTSYGDLLSSGGWAAGLAVLSVAAIGLIGLLAYRVQKTGTITDADSGPIFTAAASQMLSIAALAAILRYPPLFLALQSCTPTTELIYPLAGAFLALLTMLVIPYSNTSHTRPMIPSVLFSFIGVGLVAADTSTTTDGLGIAVMVFGGVIGVVALFGWVLRSTKSGVWVGAAVMGGIAIGVLLSTAVFRTHVEKSMVFPMLPAVASDGDLPVVEKMSDAMRVVYRGIAVPFAVAAVAVWGIEVWARLRR